MTGRKGSDQFSDSETERRATDALRHALTTPYKPQSAMKIGRKRKKKRAVKRRQKSP